MKDMSRRLRRRRIVRCATGLVGSTGLLLLTGCGFIITLGEMPDVASLDSMLEEGQSTRDDVLQVLGQPRGRGRALLPHFAHARDVWYYYREEATEVDSQRIFLYVFFDEKHYAGYMWFSSIPGVASQTLPPEPEEG